MSAEHAAHAHGDAHEESGAPHGTYRDYMTGFVLAVVLTVIPFFLVMARPIESPGYTAAIVLICAFAQILVHMVFFLHMTPTGRGRLAAPLDHLRHRLPRHHPRRLDLDRLPPQPEHDADARRRADAGDAAGSAGARITPARLNDSILTIFLSICVVHELCIKRASNELP